MLRRRIVTVLKDILAGIVTGVLATLVIATVAVVLYYAWFLFVTIALGIWSVDRFDRRFLQPWKERHAKTS